MFKIGIAICFILVTTTAVFAQDDLEQVLTQKYAENSFRDGDYEFALENYKKLYSSDKKNIDINYRIGICYTETTIDKNSAIPFLEFVVGHNNYPINSFYYLGRAYMYNYRFTQAVEAFYEYKMMGASEELLLESDRLIQMCYDALERINVPKNVKFEHLGPEVNSEFDDYYPFIDASKNMLVFTSNRTYITDYEEYIANVFYSESKKDTWTPAFPLTTNTYDNEEVVGMIPSGEKILIHADGDYSSHDIKQINGKGTKFSTAAANELPADLNTEGREMAACLSPDGNTLYYSSDRRGGRGALDIYTAKKDAKGQWSASQNLGSVINTQFDESYPSLSADGKVLYFASKGHKGAGEYDIYRSQYVDSLKSWTPPINLGFPINTPLDNTTISFLPDGKTAYIAANRKEGYGKLDIYKVTFGDESKQYVLAVTVMIGTPSKSVPYSEDFLKAYGTFYDAYDNIIAIIPVETYGQFFGTLYPGRYKLEVKFDGYTSGHTEIIEITETSEDFIQKTIYLKQ